MRHLAYLLTFMLKHHSTLRGREEALANGSTRLGTYPRQQVEVLEVLARI